MRRGDQVLLACLVLFTVAWPLLHPPLTHSPQSDLYTHLSVARNLAAGDGFVTDIVYPLSLAFPFAAHLPQPLLHRQPAYALLLLAPTWLGGSEPAVVLRGVYWLHVTLLVLLATVVLLCARRIRGTEAVLAWLILMSFNPLLAMVAGWGQIEIPVALLLTLLWCRWRRDPADQVMDRAGPTAAVVDGALAGAVTLLRLDMVWVPLLWWWVRRRRTGRRAALLAAAAWLLVVAPWAVRSARLTGHPFFSLQFYAEQLKQTDAWPGYSIYRSLSPEPLTTTLKERPGLVLDKGRAGLRFFLSDLGRWLPWSLWSVCGLLGFWMWWRGGRHHSTRLSPLSLSLLTLALLMGQYAIFSHSLRHLVVVLPVVSWEMCLWLSRRLAEWAPLWKPAQRGGLLAAAVVLCHLVTPLNLPGWQSARQEAEAAASPLAQAVTSLADLPPGPIFCDNSALFWYGGRMGVWLPLDAEVEARIREILPEMAAAPTVRLTRSGDEAVSRTPPPPARVSE